MVFFPCLNLVYIQANVFDMDKNIVFDAIRQLEYNFLLFKFIISNVVGLKRMKWSKSMNYSNVLYSPHLFVSVKRDLTTIPRNRHMEHYQ